MKRSIYFFLLLVVTLACSTEDTAPGYVAEIDAVFAQWNDSTPGGAIGIIRNGQLEYAKGYGLANLEYDIPNTPQSVFRIASVSKQFTAACIVLLAEEGKLSLEDTLSKFYPQLPEYADKITIRHLLNHTSGLRDYLQLAYLSGLTDDDFYTDEELMGWFVRQKGYNFPAGEEFLYCNTGYWLLGQIVQQVSSMNMADFARENIFEPLGMDHTHFHNENTRVVKNRASGYAPSEGGYQISMTPLEMIGDGAIFTTIEDMAKWDENFYSHKVGSSDFHQTLQTRAILNNGDSLPYAMGLRVDEYKGKKKVEHGGAFVGFRAKFLRFPDDNVSVVLLANRADANVEELTEKVADALFGFEEERQAEEEAEEAGQMNLSKEEMALFTGHYWDEASAVSRELSLVNDTLFLDENPIIAVGPQKFIGTFRRYETIVTFEGDSMSIEIPGILHWEYEKYEPARYSPPQLERLAGTYHSEELGVDYDLILKDDRLILFVDNKEISPLSPLMGVKFLNKDFGLFEFEDRMPRPNSFLLTSGRVKNLYFERRE